MVTITTQTVQRSAGLPMTAPGNATFVLMWRSRTLLLAATVLLLSFASTWPTTAAAQQYPLSYSGRIVDGKGEPRSGQVDLEFSFYDDEQAGRLLSTTPYQRSVNLVDGVFQVTLALAADEIAGIFDGQAAVWIQVKDVGTNKIYPRQRFTYVPYAMRVPVDGTTLGYDATTGQLKVISAPVTSVTAVNAGTGLTSSTSNGAVTLNVDVGTSANQIVQLNNSAKIAYSVLPIGTAANTVAAGNDTRLSDARTPTGAAGGDLTGNYPNPTLKTSASVDADRPVSTNTIKDGAITLAKLAADAVDSSKIANGSIVDADIAASAAIADSKLATISTANKVANSATTATNLNTNNAIVARDASGNFNAGTITANLTGNVTGNVSGTAANVTGTVAITNGGTGATTATAALNNLLPSQTSNSGKVLQTDGTNATWAAMSTGSGSGTGGGAAANPSSGCPTGYILVPGDTTYGTSDFCVMKYEAKFGNKGAESRATGLPARGTISQPVALASCRNLGPGYALINNSEWMTIAANIANRASNWSNNAVGNAALNRGHSDNVPANALAAVTDDNDPCNGTGQTCNASTWNDQRRTHTLSNSNVIWDFAGNIWEWVDYNIYEDKPSPATAAWTEYTSVTGTNTMAKTALVPSTATKNWWIDTWNGASNGIGQYYAGTNSSGGALLRGGQLELRDELRRVRSGSGRRSVVYDHGLRLSLCLSSPQPLGHWSLGPWSSPASLWFDGLS